MPSHPAFTAQRRRKKKKKKKRTNKAVAPTESVDLTSDPVGKVFEIRSKITKVDESLGLVFGWGIICTEDGQPYFDLQRDHAREKAMVKAVTKFMKEGAPAKEMHRGGDRGSVVHSMPMTSDIAKAFGIETKTTGWMIAMAPDKEMLAKFVSGELTGFSIGGIRIRDSVAA